MATGATGQSAKRFRLGSSQETNPISGEIAAMILLASKAGFDSDMKVFKPKPKSSCLLTPQF